MSASPTRKSQGRWLMTEFEPRIIGFLCNWCSYAGADLAGVSRYQYPPNIRIIRVMCSGRVDPSIVLKAFRRGADGVLVAGCHPADCHYINGNEKTEVRAKFLKHFLQDVDIEPRRFRLEWIAGSEGEKFAKVVNEMVASLSALGPNPLGTNSREEVETHA